MNDNSSKAAGVVRFTTTGTPEVLKIDQIEVPFPGPNEVRLQVKAFSLNRADTMFRQGYYIETPKFPSTLGYDAAGVIDAMGSDVTGFHVGDKVSVLPLFSLNDYGTYGEYILVPSYTLQKYPEKLSFEEAATIWTSYLSVYGLLINLAKIQPGQYVLINAASSSAGVAAIQLTKLAGGVPVAVTSSGAKKEGLLKVGVTNVIVSTAEDIQAEVFRITGGKGADIIIDPVGGPTFPILVSSVAEGGQIFVYGALSQEPTPFPLLDVLFKRPVIRGYSATDVLGNLTILKSAITYIIEGIEDGKLDMVISKVFPFSAVVEATKYMESNSHLGKIVVTV